MFGAIPIEILMDLQDLRTESLKRIIFLDIDGVLNTTYSLGTDDVAILPEKVLLVKQLALQTNSSIVISSSWRHNMTLAVMRVILECAGLTNVSIWGVTPETLEEGSTRLDDGSYYENYGRGAFIKQFLEENEYESYLIIDDLPTDEFLEEQQAFLLNTSSSEGMTQELVDKGAEILGFSKIQNKIRD